MASYTGTVKKYWKKGTEFPMFNPELCPSRHRYWQSEIFVIKLAGHAAIGTDDYTYAVFTAPRGLVVEAVYLIDPVGLAVDLTYYNTFELIANAVTMASVTTEYGWKAYQPVEIRLASVVVNRTLAAADAVTLKITGTSNGVAINADTEIWVVCSKV